MTPHELGGIVLCGGRGRRMGQDKATLPIGPESLLARVARILAEVVSPIVAAARPDQPLPPLPPDVLIARDAFTDAGPLAGLAAGLTTLAPHRTAAFVCTCDHPLITPAFIRRVIELSPANAPAIVEHDGRVFPLLGVYPVALVPLIIQRIQNGERRVRDLAAATNAKRIDAALLRNVDPPLHSLRNINDPQDYESLLCESGMPNNG